MRATVLILCYIKVMARSHAGVFGVAVALGFAALTCPRSAAAYSCLAPRFITPLVGSALPSNGLIWDVCYSDAFGMSLPEGWLQELCPPPTLIDSAGRGIELVVEQQVQSTRYVRVLTAYRPSEALIVGDHYLLEWAEQELDFTHSHEFSVVETDVELPPVPVVTGVDFSVRAVDDSHGAPFHARFTFEPFEGNLVADPEGLLETPFEGLDLSPAKPTTGNNGSVSVVAWDSRSRGLDGDRTYFLAKESCYVNFEAADWGATASVRFGVLDFAGNFSGWSEPVSIEYPTEVTEYPAVVRELEPQREPPYVAPVSSSCSMASQVPSSKMSSIIFLLVAAGLHRRSRLRRP